MPSIRKKETLTGNGVIDNLLEGSAFEFIGVPSRITVAATSTDTNLTMDFQIGPELLLEAAPLPQENGTGTGPQLPDNLLIEDVAAPGDRLVARIRNTTAGTPDVTVLVRIEPL